MYGSISDVASSVSLARPAPRVLIQRLARFHAPVGEIARPSHVSTRSPSPYNSGARKTGTTTDVSSTSRSSRSTASRGAPVSRDGAVVASAMARAPSAVIARVSARSGLVASSFTRTSRRSGRGASPAGACTVTFSPASRTSTAIRSAIDRASGSDGSTRSVSARCSGGTAATAGRDGRAAPGATKAET